jgi:hypothetical protein
MKHERTLTEQIVLRVPTALRADPGGARDRRGRCFGARGATVGAPNRNPQFVQPQDRRATGTNNSGVFLCEGRPFQRAAFPAELTAYANRLLLSPSRRSAIRAAQLFICSGVMSSRS